MLNSLIAYRGKYAQILANTDNKFEIKIFDDTGEKVQKVRAKDFRFLAPNFAVPTIIENPDFEILTDFKNETLSITELSEWVFGEFSPNSAWSLYLLVEDGVYFYWQQDKIFVRPSEQVEKIKQQREAERQQEVANANFIKNVALKTHTKDDLPIIAEIEKVTLGQVKSAKILTKLKIENTPQSAHKLLIDIGYYDLTFNPYPARYKIYPPIDIELVTKDTQRVDLTHLKSYAIDNIGSTDADDAISLDGDKIWVHIADVSTYVDANLLDYASKRVSNLYLPDAVINMLPAEMTDNCALGLSENSNALSIGFKLNDGQINDIEIVKSTIKVIKTDYDSVDKVIDTDFADFNLIAKNHQKYRKQQGSFSLDLPKVDVKLVDGKVVLDKQENTASRLLVAEFMILAGRVIAEFSIQNKIPMPFVTQDTGNFSDEMLQSEKLSLATSFGAIKLFKRSTTQTTPSLHFGLGLGSYLRITSPLRRYLDLVAHEQLANFINGKELLSEEQIKEFIGLNNNKSAAIGKTTKDSNNHYKLLYLLQNKEQEWTATIISKKGEKCLVMISELGMIEALKSEKELDETLQIKFKNIDIFNQTVQLKIIK